MERKCCNQPVNDRLADLDGRGVVVDRESAHRIRRALTVTGIGQGTETTLR